MINRRLYVGNLSYKTTEDDLSLFFSEAGTVEQVTIPKDPTTGRSRGFGFVLMATEEEAQEGIRRFHEGEFDGRRLTVNVAKPRADTPRREGAAHGRDHRRGNGRREARW